VNGAPAKPISGVGPSSATSIRTAVATGATAAGSSTGSVLTSAALRTGLCTTGPVPGTISSPMPAACSGTMMSLNKIAASTPCRRTGCNVISQTSSGVIQATSMG
jgi:hypothetical protein